MRLVVARVFEIGICLVRNANIFSSNGHSKSGAHIRRPPVICSDILSVTDVWIGLWIIWLHNGHDGEWNHINIINPINESSQYNPVIRSADRGRDRRQYKDGTDKNNLHISLSLVFVRAISVALDRIPSGDSRSFASIHGYARLRVPTWRVRLVGQDTALSRPVHGFESRTRCQGRFSQGKSY